MKIIAELQHSGFSISEPMYSGTEVAQLKAMLDEVDQRGTSFRKTEDLFAIRRFLQEMPEVRSIIFKPEINTLITQVLPGAVSVRSIYFDKPANSNWFVVWHQDLTISVMEKKESRLFSKWTNKDGNWAVQAPVELLENMFTLRLHLDDTDAENGALQVIPGSHLGGYIRPEQISEEMKARAQCCRVKAGGVMLMKPLLLHSSGRSTGSARRRVVHIEFSSAVLPDALHWSERVPLDTNT